MKPSIGRVVHYKDELTSNAALVIDVHDDETVDLQVFYSDGDICHSTNVKQGDESGQWNWPPRV
ncbi:hypothetical protein ACIFOE_20125 [Paenibacillus sp. NRS-1783]|uniref:hypothetical protein n=1 Tax=Paenibacillus sp. NRS-1783 TaxID=3233907 RepID=UPI003D2978BD